MKALFNWLEDRTGIATLTKEALFETVPGGARWRYVWGSTLTFAIVVQFITGIMLWMFYSPSATTAWESVYHIQNNVTGGKWLRGIHHWTAQMMVVLLVLHLVQVVIDGAYKAPREFNFWFGLALVKITLALGLTGYLLPWDQKGYWATEVATNLVANVPLVGDSLKRLIVGGSEYGHNTLTRFFALHAGVLPAALIGLIVVHIYLFRKHGITPASPKTRGSRLHFWYVALIVSGLVNWMVIENWQYIPSWIGALVGLSAIACLSRIVMLHIKKPPEDETDAKPRRDSMFWPEQVLRDAIACGVVMLAVLFLVWHFDGAELSSPADPSENYSAARPDWYFMALFYLLKDFSIIMGAFVIPGIVVGIVCLMPLLGNIRLGRWGIGHYFNLLMLIAILGGFAFYTLQGFKTDWMDDEYKQAVEAAHRDAERVQELAGAPTGIPPEGALTLVRNDSFIQGPKLFASNCASCHAWNGHDGTGKKRTDKQEASDLSDFASRAWVERLLNPETYADVNHFGGTSLHEDIGDSDMLEFVDDTFGGQTDQDKADIALIAAALSSEAGLKSQREMDAADADKIEEGWALMIDDFECRDCHKLQDEGSGKGPDLTGYGSEEWLTQFILDAGHDRFYGDKNQMPVFGQKLDQNGNETRPAQLTEREIEMLVEWMRGEWWVPGEQEETPQSTVESTSAAEVDPATEQDPAAQN